MKRKTDLFMVWKYAFGSTPRWIRVWFIAGMIGMLGFIVLVFIVLLRIALLGFN
jgi:hypothetical protein